MEMINFEELGLEYELEKISEEFYAYSAKHELLHEMIREFYSKGDFESETVKYLDVKIDAVNKKLNTVSDIQRYLRNIKDGAPFHVKRSIGGYMVRFGLSEEQAEIFLVAHRKHLSAFERSSEAWKKRTIGHIEKVVWVPEEDCLHVHYDDGEWWHYDRRGEWW